MVGPSVIQTPQMVSRISNFAQVGNGQALSCSTNSASVAFATLPPNLPFATDVLLYNDSAVNVFVAFGATAPTALAPTNGSPANGIIVPPHLYVVLNKNTAAYIAAITASSTATLYFYQGYGS